MQLIIIALTSAALAGPLQTEGGSDGPTAEESAGRGDSPRTLAGDGPTHWGGYGAPVYGMSPTSSGLISTSGGRGGAILNHRVAFGGHGSSSAAVDGGRLSYGGMFVEWKPWGTAVVHPNFDVAWGSGTWRPKDSEKSEREKVQVIQGAVRAEVSVVSWFRLSAGLTARRA